MIVLLFAVGCGKEGDSTPLESSTVTESSNYILNDFNEDNLQEFSSHGMTIMIPEIWQMSTEGDEKNKSVVFNFDYGMMSISVNYSDEELNLKDDTEAYKELLINDSTMSLTDNREEIYSNQEMSVLEWNDEVNGNKIHGTTYLFVTQHWFYNISLAAYEEVSYKQELLNIMDTFEFDESGIESIPSHIVELFNQYESIISSGNYDIRLGEKVGVDDREDDYTYYNISLCPSDPDIVSYPCVQFYSNNEYTNKSFSIDCLEYCSNSVVKEIIFCTLLATNPNMSVDDVAELQAELINSYNGYEQSKVVETERYKYFLTTDPHFNGMYFRAVAKEEINIPVEKELYSEYSINEMQAELNVGERAFVKGIVEAEELDWITNTLRISNNDKKYYIHYRPESFPGEFYEGKEYIFYGTINTECDTESGCLRLDYYEVVDDSYNETDSNESNSIDESAKINVTFLKDYVDGDRLYLKVYVKNNSDKIFTGDIHVFFYSADGKERLGSDMIIVEELAPGRESWANVNIDKYDRTPKLELEFSNPTFTEVEVITSEIDAEATEKTKNSYSLNFEGVSWYNDITNIVVYEDGSCIVTIKSGAKEDGQFYAATIWSCGNNHGVETVQVIDSNGVLQAVYP